MSKQSYKNGIAVRKQVMGETHVKLTMSQVTEFTALLQPLESEWK